MKFIAVLFAALTLSSTAAAQEVCKPLYLAWETNDHRTYNSNIKTEEGTDLGRISYMNVVNMTFINLNYDGNSYSITGGNSDQILFGFDNKDTRVKLFKGIDAHPVLEVCEYKD